MEEQRTALSNRFLLSHFVYDNLHCTTKHQQKKWREGYTEFVFMYEWLEPLMNTAHTSIVSHKEDFIFLAEPFNSFQIYIVDLHTKAI